MELLDLCSVYDECLRTEEEEEKNALEASRDSSKRDHPPPAPVRVCECRIDSVCDDLAAGNRNHVHDDHTASQMSRGELLDVEWGNACSNTDADADEKTATNLIGRVSSEAERYTYM